MEIKISGTPKEIADLALELQNRLNTYEEVNPAVLAQNVMKGINHLQNEHRKPEENCEVTLFNDKITVASTKNHETIERTFADVKRNFQKMLESIKTMEGSETPSPFRKENT